MAPGFIKMSKQEEPERGLSDILEEENDQILWQVGFRGVREVKIHGRPCGLQPEMTVAMRMMRCCGVTSGLCCSSVWSIVLW